MTVILTGRIRIPSSGFPTEEIMQVFKNGFAKSDRFFNMVRRMASSNPLKFDPKESFAQNLLFVLLSDHYKDVSAKNIASKLEAGRELIYQDGLEDPPEINIIDDELVISSECNAQPWILGMSAAAIMRAYDMDGVAKGGVSGLVDQNGPAKTHPHFGMSVVASKYGHRMIQYFDIDKQVTKDLEEGAYSFLLAPKSLSKDITTMHEPSMIMRVKSVYDDEAHLIPAWLREKMNKSLDAAKNGQATREQLPDQYKDLDLKKIASDMDSRGFKRQVENLEIYQLSPEAFSNLKNAFFVNEFHYSG